MSLAPWLASLGPRFRPFSLSAAGGVGCAGAPIIVQSSGPNIPEGLVALQARVGGVRRYRMGVEGEGG